MIDAGSLPRPAATTIIAALLVCARAAWVLMMVAMMFPTIAPMVLTHAT